MAKKGLHKALFKMFPDVPTQLCTSHKQRRINQIVPRIYGDGYDKLFSRLARQAINAPPRYHSPYPIDYTTTNHLEGINSFLKERIKLMKGFKKAENAMLLIKLLIYYYRFHKFTSSKFKHKKGRCPIELNDLQNRDLLSKMLKGDQPYSWIKNLISSP